MTAERPRAGGAAAEPAGATIEEIVSRCRAGDGRAWDALIDRYQRLIYSVPVRFGLEPEDAADVFQGVCLDLLSELPRLRDPRALPAWLLRVAFRRCLHLRRRERRYLPLDSEREAALAEEQEPDWLSELQQEQGMREALASLAPRCREIVQMLFYEDPPRPYAQVARALGLAVGSIGFMRGRCLSALRRALEGGLRR